MFTSETFVGAGPSISGTRGPRHGRPILFLHGVLRDHRDFHLLWSSFLWGWEVVGVDHRGHGRSGRDEQGRYLVKDYGADIAQIVHRFDRPVVLVGHSLGALAALWAAAHSPDRVAGVILEDPPISSMGAKIHGTTYHELFKALKHFRERMEVARPLTELAWELGRVEVPTVASKKNIPLSTTRDAATLRYGADCLTRVDPRVFEPLISGAWMEGYDWQALASVARSPALVLQGDVSLGGALADQDATALAERLPQGHLIRRAGVGHLIHEQDPAWFTRVTMDFLATV